jgi:hypothetical protein
MVGHVTKMASLAYAPAVIGAFLLILQRKYWSGSALLILFSFLMISQNHVQIVFYTLLIALSIAVAFAIKTLREKEGLQLIKSFPLAAIAAVIGLGAAAVSLYPSYEFSKETIRGGKSELTDTTSNAGNKTKGGLDKDYAFNWSYGIDETLTLLVPGAFGGSSGGELGENSAVAKTLLEQGVPEDNATQIARSLPSYWGPQPNTSGPVYLGAIICFLFILGMVYLDSWHKWWIAAITLLSIMLAWGGNLKAFNYFIFDYLPLYNKFRAPTMALVIPQFTASLMAAMVVSKFLSGTDAREILFKKLKLATYITAGLLAITSMLYFSYSYSGKNDNQIKENFAANMMQGQQPGPQLQQQANEFGQSIVRALGEDRKGMFGGDLLRTVLFIAAAIVLLGLFAKNKLNQTIVIAGLIILSGIDLFTVGQRYLKEDNFVEPTNIEEQFAMTDADRMIKSDPDQNFRIFNTDDPFNNAKPSYHHNSVGGYNPAKLSLYQDLIEHQLAKGNMKVFDMLNTRYFVVQDPQTGKTVAQRNVGALGTVWLVKGLRFVNNADEEMAALDNFNPKDTAVIDKRYQTQVKIPLIDSTATIIQKENLNDVIRYESNAASPQFAVFSEVYYDKGWNAYIDGKQSDYIRVNYVLRGMNIPSGKHSIEFRFEPAAYKTGNKIALWSTVIALLVFLGSIFLIIKNKKIV